eukprot:8192239-Alexandrium_andersonii.AAC.1
MHRWGAPERRAAACRGGQRGRRGRALGPRALLCAKVRSVLLPRGVPEVPILLAVQAVRATGSSGVLGLSLIHISEPTRLALI